MTPYKKVGLFGGTFDPIHYGHLKAANDISAKLNLDRIYFIPAYIPPHKTDLGITSSHHRLEMVKRAIQGSLKFSVSEYELNKKEISFSIETIKHYKNLLPTEAELYFIVGTDAFLGISTWKEVPEIFANCNMIVVSRPGYTLKPFDQIIKNPKLFKEFVMIKDGEEYKHYTGHYIYLFQLGSIDISSTELRKRIAEGKSFASYLPDAVIDYIHTHSLYLKNRFKTDEGA